jgi:hypothetical protein
MSARSGSRGVVWLAAPVIFLLVWLVLYPNLFVVADSLRGEIGITSEHYRRFFESRAEMRALWNSVWISLAQRASRRPHRHTARLPLQPLRVPRPAGARRPRRRYRCFCRRWSV